MSDHVVLKILHFGDEDVDCLWNRVPFDPTTDEWSEYVERLQFYFTANGIKDDSKKRAVLLSNCGQSTFRLLRSIVLPAPLTDFSFSELVSKMKAHREPRPSVIVQRYQFNSRQRLPSESMAEYIAALQKLAEFCNYGESLDEMLRDRFVCGIAHPAVQKRLLAEPDLTLTKAVTVAQAVELAEKGAQQLQLPVDKEAKEVHKFSTTNSQPRADTRKKDSSSGGKASSTSCYRCGGKHNQQTCRFKSETCHFCNKRGHIAKVCRSKKRQSPPGKPPNLDARVRQNQYHQKEPHDYHAKDCDFREGDNVLTKNFSSGEPWLCGTIHKKVGPVSFIVKLSDGRIVNRHLDQLRENSVNNGHSY